MSFNPKDFYEKGSNKIIRTGLQLFLDAGNTSSYPGSGTTWTDISGNSRNGTLTNGPTFSSGNGGSILFDGSNDYVGGTGIDNASTSLNGQSATSISFWLKRTAISGSGNRTFLGFSNTSGSHKIIISFNNTDKLVVGVRSNVEALQTKTTVNSFTSTTAWYHVVATISLSSNTINIYVNGVLESSTGTISFFQTTFANGTTATNNRIGSELAGGTTNFNGNIAQVLLYNKVLSATEISLNFNYQKNKYGL
jgi:hypothetical protein